MTKLEYHQVSPGFWRVLIVGDATEKPFIFGSISESKEGWPFRRRTVYEARTILEMIETDYFHRTTFGKGNCISLDTAKEFMEFALACLRRRLTAENQSQKSEPHQHTRGFANERREENPIQRCA